MRRRFIAPLEMTKIFMSSLSEARSAKREDLIIMTKVLINKKDGHIISVSARGHTDYALEGEDIVCAALSSVMQTALLGLLSVAKIQMSFERDEEDGLLKFDIPALDKQQRHDADMILDTMLAGIVDLHENFSKFIGLKIVKG